LDAFSGYHQIKTAKEDEEKTAFITPCRVYCYVCMPFGLKNPGATFQRLMRKALGAQMGRNTEAYIDDIIVKTREGPTLVEDLEGTSANLRKVNIKLNPAKCAFGVPSGKLLGFLFLTTESRQTPTRSSPSRRCVCRATSRKCSASLSVFWIPGYPSPPAPGPRHRPIFSPGESDDPSYGRRPS
jgi:hypothetical protein